MSHPQPTSIPLRKVLIVGGIGDSLIRFRGHLIKSLVEQGFSVTAAAAAEDGIAEKSGLEITQTLAGIGVRYCPIPMQRTGNSPVRDLGTLWALIRLCQKERPDYLVCYTAKAVAYGMLAGWIMRVPQRVAMITGLAYGMEPPMPRASLTLQIAHFLFRRALRRSHCLIFQNPDDRQTLLSAGMVSPGIRMGLVNGSGVDLSLFQPGPLPLNPVCFLMIARLLKEKGVSEYLMASRSVKSQFPNARFLLVGPLDRHPTAVSEEEITSWVMDGIGEWLGPVSDVRLPLSQATVYVLPSYHEGTPRTVLEAMAMSRPIITTDAPGCRETVVDQENGFLVRPRDWEHLAQAMTKCASTPEILVPMGEKSLEMAKDKYEVSLVTAQTLRLILSPSHVQKQALGSLH